jgi:hypothetical protein
MSAKFDRVRVFHQKENPHTFSLIEVPVENSHDIKVGTGGWLKDTQFTKFQ